MLLSAPLVTTGLVLASARFGIRAAKGYGAMTKRAHIAPPDM